MSCAVDTCDRRVSAKGLCKVHYERQRIGRTVAVPIRPSYRDLPVEDRVKLFSLPGSDGCVVWIGSRSGDGYGSIKVDGRTRGAHRVAYELANGPIPDGLELDHLCRNRACVNPDHLEPVTKYENFIRGTSPWAANARKTHCPAGHPYDDENTIVNSRGSRECRSCRRDKVDVDGWLRSEVG